jgi:hypothetical protein
VGYLRDCQRANISPSIFQIILFGYYSATVPSPPFWLPIWLLTAINWFLATWIAERLLGYVTISNMCLIITENGGMVRYRPSYPEYNRAAECSDASNKKSI